jgi:O-antigen ligase
MTTPSTARYLAPGAVALFFALQGADRTLPLAWAALALGAALAASCRAIDFQRPLSAIEKGMGIALLGWVVSVVCGLDPRRSLALSVPMLASLLLWILIARNRDARFSFSAVALGLAGAAFVQAGLLVLAAVRHPALAPSDWVIDAGATWLIVPNDIAWMACALPMWAVAMRGRTPISLGVLLVTMLALSALLHSRTAAIVAAAVAIAFVFPSSQGQRRSGSWWVAGFAFIGLGTLALGVASMRARMQLWAAALDVFFDHPWTGIGMHNFVLAYGCYLPIATSIDPRITPWPHNLFLEILAECGVIGGAAMLFLIGCIVRRGMAACRSRPTPSQRAVLAGLFGVVLLAFVEASLLRIWVWALGTALCALIDSRTEPVGDNEKKTEE